MPAVASAPVKSPLKPSAKFSTSPSSKPSAADHPILFQKFFKSVGPRTYAAQIKKANNGNHYLILTEGKRDEKTGEVRKTRLFLFGEDFVAFFRMLHDTAQFIKANPVPEEIQKKRAKMWNRRQADASKALSAANGTSSSRPLLQNATGCYNGGRSNAGPALVAKRSAPPAPPTRAPFRRPAPKPTTTR